jgi:hypothetical protein
MSPRPRGSRARAQTSIYETTLEDAELEKALETRQSKKDAVDEAKHNFKVADDIVQPMIDKLDLGHDAAIRVGRFVIVQKARKGRTVESFEVAPTTQTKIKVLDED